MDIKVGSYKYDYSFFDHCIYGASENIHVNGAWEKGASMLICFHDQFSNIDQFVLIHKAGHQTRVLKVMQLHA